MVLPYGSREQFLAAVHADQQLQAALRNQETARAAIRIASAAGFEISAADLVCPSTVGPGRAGNTPKDQEGEGECIDFDGDGIPDAIRKDNRWIILDSND